MNKEILEARSNNSYVLFKSHCMNVPEWIDLLEILHRSYHHFQNGNIKDSNIPAESILIRNHLDPIVVNALMFSDINFNSHDHSPFKITRDILEEMMGRGFTNSTMVLNFVGDEYDYKSKYYEYDTLIWHCAGVAEWRLYKESDKSMEDDLNYDTVELNPGDVLFLSSGLTYQIVPKNSTAFIRFAYL